MHKEIAAGKFREDLYFRLSVLPLQWAPLRERQEDILPLAQALLNRHANKQHRLAVQLSPSAKEALIVYSWPGNVRELDNVMQRSLILQAGSLIEAQDLGLHMFNNMSVKPNFFEAQRSSLEASRPQSAADIPVSFTTPQAKNWLLDDEFDEAENAGLGSDLRQREYEIIVDTLKKEHGSKKNTADRLGISARTLRYKLARLRDEGFCFEQA
jgi:two-component system, response regulator FlrC